MLRPEQSKDMFIFKIRLTIKIIIVITKRKQHAFYQPRTEEN